MLEAVDLECQRGDRLLFSGLSLRVASRGCLHVAGENGSGKTSLLRILCGLMLPVAGSVRWEGEDIRRLREAYWEQLVYVGHLNGVKDDLTAAENVHVAAAIAGWTADPATVRDALRDPHALGIRLYINGALRQIGSTADLVYSIPELLVFMSGFMTLRPGDLLITGTPPGRVSVGAGDSLRVEIDGLGSLENVVTAESSVAHREASS